MSEEVVVSTRRVPAAVVWHPRALARPTRRKGAPPVASETRGVVCGIAFCLALLFLLELHIHKLAVPASVEGETVAAVHGWRRR